MSETDYNTLITERGIAVMSTGGDAAEQVVRLSLEGFEAAAKLTGTAAKELAVLPEALKICKKSIILAFLP